MASRYQLPMLTVMFNNRAYYNDWEHQIRMAKLRGTDEQLSMGSLRLMRAEAPVACDKAKRELGWEPRPVEESIREAARFWVGLREARRKTKSPSDGSAS